MVPEQDQVVWSRSLTGLIYNIVPYFLKGVNVVLHIVNVNQSTQVLNFNKILLFIYFWPQDNLGPNALGATIMVYVVLYW